MKHTLTLLTALLLAPLAVLHAAEPPKPNIVVMVADDLGSGDVSCLFRSVVKTPNIDRIASMGVKFTSGYVTAPLCGPSRAGFFTGRYQERFGFVNNGGGIPTSLPLLPGVLHDAGYRTALLGKWHSAGPMPFERGCFDESLCSPVSSPFINYHHPKLSHNGKPEQFDRYSTDLFADEAEGFIDRNRDRPFMLTVTFNAPHILNVVKPAPEIRSDYEASLAAGKPIDVPKTPMARPGDAEKFAALFPGDTARADTVATITALDQAVGRILDKLKQDGLERKTIVFFFADNGAHPENRSENLPLRDYKWTVYEGGIRVPFLAMYPGVFPAGLTFSKAVSTLDIFPTCAALAGIKAPAGLDGVDLTSYLKGETTDAPHEALFFSQGGMAAVRQGSWKLVMTGPTSQLFDLSKDIEEKNDLAATEAVRVEELTEKWKVWNAQMSKQAKSAGAKPNVSNPEGTIRNTEPK